MSFVQLSGLNEVQEAKIAPEGEYDLVINFAKVREKDGNKNILCSLGIESEDLEEYANILHNVALPSAEDDPDKKKFKMLFLRRFLDEFDIMYDETGFDIETFVGSRAAKVKVKQDEYQGQRKNIIELRALEE